MAAGSEAFSASLPDDSSLACHLSLSQKKKKKKAKHAKRLLVSVFVMVCNPAKLLFTVFYLLFGIATASLKHFLHFSSIAA